MNQRPTDAREGTHATVHAAEILPRARHRDLRSHHALAGLVDGRHTGGIGRGLLQLQSQSLPVLLHGGESISAVLTRLQGKQLEPARGFLGRNQKMLLVLPLDHAGVGDASDRRDPHQHIVGRRSRIFLRRLHRERRLRPKRLVARCRVVDRRQRGVGRRVGGGRGRRLCAQRQDRGH